MKKNVVKNTSWLFVFNMSKIIFPFITLPYLTRVLSVESYGIVTYLKTVMAYMQIFVDFGFVLSGTRDVVKSLTSKNNNVSTVIGDTMLSRIFLGFIGFLIVGVLSLFLPILRENILFTFMSYFVVFESIFLMDFVFRGYEKMHIIALRFIIMKTISTVLTFVLIKNDSNLLLIPLLDIISSLIAVLLVFYEFKKLNIKIKKTNIYNIINKIKESFVYFLSNAASTSFNALSTIIIGIVLSKTEVAYWGICMQIIGTIQALYNPICDGIYPEMIRTKNINIVKKCLKLFMPIVIVGSIICFIFAPFGMKLLGGSKYLNAVNVFRMLIPCLIISFPGIIYGWPTIGALGKAKLVTKSTVFSILFNIIVLLLLIVLKRFTLMNIALIRVFTEIVLFSIRYYYYKQNKNNFSDIKEVS